MTAGSPGRRSGRMLALAGAVAASALLLAACTADPEPAGSSAAAAPTASEASPSVTVTPTPDAEAPLTCETLIPEDVVDSFTKQGWTAKTDTFRIGATEIPDGLWCVWGDYSVASDHVQVYGLATVSDDEAQAARSDLIASGWRVVDDASGDYVTENPDTALALDEDGYGMTYEFGEGWVAISDTKQGLLLVAHPED